MSSERSFADRAQRARELHAAVSTMGPPYEPVDPQYSLAALNLAITAAEGASAIVAQVRPAYQDPTSDRAALFSSASPLVTQALAHTKSNTAWANRLEAIKKIADKVRGIRPPRQAPDPEPDARTRETGERSYVEMAAHLRSFIDRLAALPGYEPTDPRISLEGLDQVWIKLDELNRNIPAVARTLADAITDRQQIYTGPKGLKFVFDGVKVSVKGQYGQQSVPYKTISGMKW